MEENEDEPMNRRSQRENPSFPNHETTTINIGGFSPHNGKKISKAKIILAVVILGILLLIFLNIPRGFHNDIIFGEEDYPYGDPLLGTIKDGSVVKNEFDFLAIADRDEHSYNKDTNTWDSVIVSGTLKRMIDGRYEVIRTEMIPISGMFNEGTKYGVHRGMELSALKIFNRKLFTCCDRTGIVYEILPKETTSSSSTFSSNERSGGSDSSESENVNKELMAIPRYILPNGDGYTESKGFKCEWITVKDGHMYVGSIGKEYNYKNGDVGKGPLYIKRISKEGIVEHIDWSSVYDSIKQSFGEDVYNNGYIVLEGVEYNSDLGEWFFLPRRISKEKYDPSTESFHGSNSFVRLSENLKRPKVIETKLKPKMGIGFSAVKFIPGRTKEMVTLRTYEPEHDTTTIDDDVPKWKTYLSVITTDGEVLLNEYELANEKLEGIEIAKKRE